MPKARLLTRQAVRFSARSAGLTDNEMMYLDRQDGEDPEDPERSDRRWHGAAFVACIAFKRASVESHTKCIHTGPDATCRSPLMLRVSTSERHPSASLEGRGEGGFFRIVIQAGSGCAM